LLKDHGSDANVTANETIAVSGDFGTIQVGRFEDFTESQISGVADTWDPMDGFSLEMQNTNSARTNGGMAYVSPSFNGLTFGIGGFAVESGATTLAAADATALNRWVTNQGQATAQGFAAADVISTDNDNQIDATDIMLAYSNGPLALKYTRESFKDTTFIVSEDGDTNMAASAAVLNALTSGESSDNFAVSYSMGDLKVTATYQDRENLNNWNGADVDGYFVGAKYTMGANELSAGMAKHDYNVRATGTLMGANAVANQSMEHEGYILGLKHNMSKNTGIYAAYQSQEVNYSGAAAGNATANRDDDRFGVGIQHKF
jgi:predicted porin